MLHHSLDLLAVMLLGMISLATSFCPVTSTMDLNNTDSLLYPLDVYGSPLLLHQQQALNNTFPCYGFVTDKPRLEYSCSTHRFCPVQSQNIHDAIKHKKHKGNLCQLASKLRNKSETVRVAVLGGSVPAGCKTKWCTRERHDEEYQFRCSWGYHFATWLNNTNEANVQVINMARMAKTSYFAALEYFDLMKMNKIAKFTASDLVMLDFSANDAWRGHQDTVEREYEKLIRTIYMKLSETNSWPTVIALDSTPKRQYGSPPYDAYSLAYENVTNHYKLPLWSFKDMARSSFAQESQKQYIEFLMFNRVEPSYDMHPQWHVHLFMADLYSAILLTEFNHCSIAAVARSELMHSQPIVLPKPVAPEKNGCDPGMTSFLSMSYDKIMNNMSIGSYAFSDGLWSLREDRKGKGGFIFELPSENYNVKSPSKVVFTLTNTTAELKKLGHLRVELVFMRTYKNAGLLYAYVNGSNVDPLDALWDDHISTPFFKEMRLVPEYYTTEYPTVELVFPPAESKGGVRGTQKVKIYQVNACVWV